MQPPYTLIIISIIKKIYTPLLVCWLPRLSDNKVNSV